MPSARLGFKSQLHRLEDTLKLFKLLFSHLYKENSILYITDVGHGDEDMDIKASNSIGGATWILKKDNLPCLPGSEFSGSEFSRVLCRTLIL